MTAWLGAFTDPRTMLWITGAVYVSANLPILLSSVRRYRAFPT